MKGFLCILLARSALQAFAQPPDSLDRDRSKYATNSFSECLEMKLQNSIFARYFDNFETA